LPWFRFRAPIAVPAAPLKVKEKGRLEFKPGQKINVAFAVWNGQAKDRNGQKMVSIWNEFTLEK
jgi:DMSO reductase family type II enzyme heme b subunit